MKPVLVFQHGDNIPAGYLGEVLARQGVPVATVPLYAGAAVPGDFDWSAVVSLGGEMGAYQEDRFPFLAAEKQFLRRAADVGLPVLGICLGCQLLADALGGHAYKAEEMELGLVSLDLTGAGAADPVVSQFDRPVLSWHQDTWDPPPRADMLATTPGFAHAFRQGSVLGMQSHPEASPKIFKEWAAIEGLDHFEKAGVDRSALEAEVDRHGPASEDLARRIFEAWLRHDVGLEFDD